MHPSHGRSVPVAPQDSGGPRNTLWPYHTSWLRPFGHVQCDAAMMPCARSEPSLSSSVARVARGSRTLRRDLRPVLGCAKACRLGLPRRPLRRRQSNGSTGLTPSSVDRISWTPTRTCIGRTSAPRSSPRRRTCEGTQVRTGIQAERREIPIRQPSVGGGLGLALQRARDRRRSPRAARRRRPSQPSDEARRLLGSGLKHEVEPGLPRLDVVGLTLASGYESCVFLRE
jgi:hypothetical protein